MGLGLDATAAPREETVTAVSRGYFDLLGVRWSSGRGFSSEEHSGGRAVLVVSEAFVREHLGDDAAPVGRTVCLNGHLHEIVGVVADFRGLERLGRDDLWVPFRDNLRIGEPGTTGEPPRAFLMVGRLRAGATLEQAQAQVLVASRSVGPVTGQTTTYDPTLFPGLTDGIGYTQDQLTLRSEARAIPSPPTCSEPGKMSARSRTRRGARF